MAGRTMWKGSIQFGDVSVPVKLHTAVKQDRIAFHLLHRHDLTRLQQRMFCAYEKVPVPAEEQVKGFLWEENTYILVDAEELERTEAEANRAIEVHEFVGGDEIDPVFLEHAYYLEPSAPPAPYRELVLALQETGTAGICTWAMRGRSYFGALRANGSILVLHTLRYADEVIAAGALELDAPPLSEKELAIGKDLIDRLSAAFEPRKFENEHQKKLKELIDRKIRGEETALKFPKRLKTTPPDRLLQALEASLKKVA